MFTQNPKAVSSSPNNILSAAPVWRMGVLLLFCAALFAGCGGGDSDPKLAKALADMESPDELTRSAGIDELAGMGEKAKPHTDKVAALLKDTSKGVRASAISFMVAMKDNSPEIVQELVAMASGDAESEVQTSALHGLKGVGAHEQFIKGCKEMIAGGEAAKQGEAIMYLSEAAIDGVAGAKEELEAIAGGSDADLAKSANKALEMVK